MGLAMLVGALAVHHSTLEPVWFRELSAAVPVAMAGFVAFAKPFRVVVCTWIISVAVLAIWYLHDRPSNDRDWESEYAILTRFSVHDRIVSARNVRNFSYRSEVAYTPACYDAVFSLDDLESVDFISSYWAGDAIAHVFLTFGFRDGRYVAFSIETRRAKGVGYSTVAGLFHHYELFYVVADERDLIGVRTDIRREQVYLYRLRLTPQARVRYNWRVLLSGHAAEYAYSLGLLDDDQPFADLRRQSLIERGPVANITPTFSADIRNGLPLAR